MHPRGHRWPHGCPTPTGEALLTCCFKMHLYRGVAVGSLASLVDTGHTKLGSAPGR